MADLARFLVAQEAVLAAVRSELAHGEKRSHWMWFIFPQVAGLGTSPMARSYAIESLDEARAYLAHPTLGERLVECTRLVLGWAGRRSATAILGSVDAMKFRSSMTLFELAAGSGSKEAGLFAQALDTFYEGRRDGRTLGLLGLSARQ